jgi:hypothetical protein
LWSRDDDLFFTPKLSREFKFWFILPNIVKPFPYILPMLSKTMPESIFAHGYSASLVACSVAILIASVALVLHSRRNNLGIPRVGLKPGVLGNTSKGHFHHNALNLVQEGYSRVRYYKASFPVSSLIYLQYKDSLYSLWTTEMDRVIVSQKFMKDFGSLSRSQLHLTATRRLAGPCKLGSLETKLFSRTR